MAAMLILSMVCVWCGGCGRKDKNSLETLKLQEGQGDTDMEDVVQDDSFFSENFGGTEKNGDGKKNENSNSQEIEQAGAESIQQIFVYVCGAVNSPGVYELKAGARLYEAIACAGGVREDAAEESINQAQTVADGERLYIPTDEEVCQGLHAYLQSGFAGGKAGSGEATGIDAIFAGEKSSGTVDGKVNINTASKEELKTLNGIGDTRAGSILAYRESNGLFGSIEELMKVEGIKEGVYNKLKDDITVN